MNDEKCKTKLEVARKLIQKANQKMGSWVEANDIIS